MYVCIIKNGKIGSSKTCNIMIYNNKDLIQSYILTSARYDFSIPEKRILYGIIELMQWYTEGKKLDRKYQITVNMFGDVDIVMPISKFLKDAKSHNYKHVKDALLGLNSKIIQYEDEKVWKAFNLIERPDIKKGDETVSLRIHPLVAEAFNDFSKGFSKYEYQTIMQFESVYAMRFYELFAQQKSKIIYSIDKLKLMFGVENKYIDKPSNFIDKVVKVAQAELDRKSPVSFKFDPIKAGKKIVKIAFYPVKIVGNRDPVLEAKELQKQVSLRYDLDLITINYLKEFYLFTDNQIHSNIEVFKKAENEFPDFLNTLSHMRTTTKKASNQKGALINAIKKQLNGGIRPKNSVPLDKLTGLINVVLNKDIEPKLTLAQQIEILNNRNK